MQEANLQNIVPEWKLTNCPDAFCARFSGRDRVRAFSGHGGITLQPEKCIEFSSGH